MPLLHVKDLSVPCQGILFDKDGTLLDLLATWGSWAEEVLLGLGNELALRVPDRMLICPRCLAQLIMLKGR